METPLGGKGWGPHLLLQGIFSVPGTAQKVGAKSHTTTALTHRQPCLSLLTPLCVFPTLPQARAAFHPPGLSAPAPATPQQGQSPCLAMAPPNSVHASREVTEAWGWGCPKGSQLSCFWPCCWDMHFKRKQLPENS